MFDFSYKIFSEQRFILVRYFGTVSYDDVIQATEALWEDPMYSPEFNGIIDLSSIRVAASVKDLGKLVKFVRDPRCSTGSWAAVFTEPKATALGMLYKATRGLRHSLHLFSSWEAACDYHGVDYPETLLGTE